MSPNFLGLTGEWADPVASGVVVLPVPFERTSTFGWNSRLGPDAILEASVELEWFDSQLGFEPFRTCGGVTTLPALDVENVAAAMLAPALCTMVSGLMESGKFVVTLGGEHSSVVGAIQAHCVRFADVTVLQLDAHSDLRPAYLGSPWNHACAMARVLDFHERLVQVGIRSQDVSERVIAEERALPVFHAHEIHDRSEAGRDWIGEIISALSQRVYVTFDCDVFDPSIIPATGTPEPGGLTWRQIDKLFARLCAEREVVGLDVSELAPLPGLLAPQATVAKLINRFLGYRFAPAS